MSTPTPGSAAPSPSEPSSPAASGAEAAHHLAQINLGLLKAELDDPSMKGFTDQLEPINALADHAPGFVWRLIEEGEADATALRPFGPSTIVNFSVWRDVEALWDFTYRSEHLDLLRRRRTWFERMDGVLLALWWIPAGTIPTVEEAGRKLDLLREIGPSPEAFTLRTPFPPPTSHHQHA
ncbi:uncharacterized protein DUF3291 [Nocardiopsis sp. Huas11]|uniref:DUF3291 domain-containing protein n=1 Tax=Nocardiopsis sp. Huas11 TaxID=2183912 RepID=UPI000EAC1F04|nr:DUF3291 domain-containing protein [Nocardiopsis sp. Huas11]RKS06216.1 uncharacterized protein DUF3291 [Nocardiopsis sp. Huas11]